VTADDDLIIWLTKRVRHRVSKLSTRTLRLAALQADRSLAGTPVDTLAERAGMPGVPGILLDHVDKHVSRCWPPLGHG
jgi:hypothetical protein